MQKNRPKLSIVIVSFNTAKLTIDCIKSIYKHTKNLDFEVVVVDNGSSDKSLKELKKLSYLNLKIIESKTNLGFGQGNNLGIKSSSGQYILLLNSDTLLVMDILKDMVDWMDKNPKIGVLSCALKNKDGSIQGSGGYFPTPLRVFSWLTFLEDLPLISNIIKPFHPMHLKSPIWKNEEFFNKEDERDWVTGAFMLIKKEVFKVAGMFDPEYFMYMEEVDLCFRIKKAGYKIMYVPRWEIIHLGGGSGSGEKTILNEFKSLRIFYKKWYKNYLLFMNLMIRLGIVLRIILFGILGKTNESKTYAKIFNQI